MKLNKTLLLAVALCTAAPVLSAQETITTGQWVETEKGTDKNGNYVLEKTHEKGVYISSGMWKKWTVTAAVGVQAYLGDNDWKGKFKDMITGPAVDIYIDKWITPVFGIGLGFTYSPFKGLYQRRDTVASFRTDEYFGKYNSQELYRQRGHTFNPYVIALIDIDNLIAGFDPLRFYNIALYAGGGLILGNDPIQTRCGATFNLGLYNIFNVHKDWDIFLNLRGSIVSDGFDGEFRLTEKQTAEYIRRNVPYDGTAGLTAGAIYHFGKTTKKRHWEKTSKVTKLYTDLPEARKEIAALKEDLKRETEKNIVLEKATKEKEIIKEPSDLWYHVQFVIDKWDVLRRELVNLEYIASVMKSSPDTKFQLCGYADVQTATPSHNLMLSRNRVNEVFKVLTQKFGVNPDQLVKDYKGGVDLMFYKDNVLTRCVIIKTVDGKPFVHGEK